MVAFFAIGFAKADTNTQIIETKNCGVRSDGQNAVITYGDKDVGGSLIRPSRARNPLIDFVEDYADLQRLGFCAPATEVECSLSFVDGFPSIMLNGKFLALTDIKNPSFPERFVINREEWLVAPKSWFYNLEEGDQGFSKICSLPKTSPNCSIVKDGEDKYNFIFGSDVKQVFEARLFAKYYGLLLELSEFKFCSVPKGDWLLITDELCKIDPKFFFCKS